MNINLLKDNSKDDDDISGVTTPRELLSLANKSIILDESSSNNNIKDNTNDDINNLRNHNNNVDSDLSDDNEDIDGNNSNTKKTKITTIHNDKIINEKRTCKVKNNNMFTRNADKANNVSNIEEFQDQLGELKYPKEFNPKRSSVATALSMNAITKTKKKDKAHKDDKDVKNKQVLSSAGSVTSKGSTQNHIKEISNIVGQKYTRLLSNRKEEIVHDKDDKIKYLNKLPGGLNLKRSETNTYFGDDSRREFFERCKYIHTQKKILKTQITDETDILHFPDSFIFNSGQIILDGLENIEILNQATEKEAAMVKRNRDESHTITSNTAKDSISETIKIDGDSTLTITTKHVQHRNKNTLLVNDHAFTPSRAISETPLKVNTKVIIRTQSLLQGDSFEQIKLIPKPIFIRDIDELLLNDHNESDELIPNDDDEIDKRNADKNLSLSQLGVENLHHLPCTIMLRESQLECDTSTVLSSTSSSVTGLDNTTTLAGSGGDSPTKNRSSRIASSIILEHHAPDVIGLISPDKQALVTGLASSKQEQVRQAGLTRRNAAVKSNLGNNTIAGDAILAKLNTLQKELSENKHTVRTLAPIRHKYNQAPPTLVTASHSHKVAMTSHHNYPLHTNNHVHITQESSVHTGSPTIQSPHKSAPLTTVLPIVVEAESPLAIAKRQREEAIALYVPSYNLKKTNNSPYSMEAIGRVHSVSNQSIASSSVSNSFSREKSTIKESMSSISPSLPGVVVDTSIQATDKLSRMRKLEMALDNVVAPLELVCIEKRDKKNHIVPTTVKSNSLFKYIQLKQTQYDFNASSYSSESEEEKSEEQSDAFEQQQQQQQSNNKPDTSNHYYHKHNNSSVSIHAAALSPRSKYIDSCIRLGLNPRASIIIRKNLTRRIELQHHGIGDVMARLLADAIISIPYIEALNIADNNLTDAGLGPLVKAAVHMQGLVDLDISFNTLGPITSECLSNYLANPQCVLERLALRHADVDDGECEGFVMSLKTNSSLVTLDLSENLIGSAENLNTVMPDFVTGSEALADLLRSENCHLKTLCLGWNMIRLDGAIDLCSSIEINQTLTYLDLSYNALGAVGGITLGNSLYGNVSLKHLNIASNSIDSIACITICAGILVNENLQHVVFDGNPIGVHGAKSLMMLPAMVGNRVTISAASCNIGIRDANCWFDSTMLVRTFELNLSDSFERAIANMLMFIIASHQTYLIALSEYTDVETNIKTNLLLKEKIIIDPEFKRLLPNQIKQLEALQKVKLASSNREAALTLFKETDQDGSGELDEEEFGNLLHELGFELSPSEVQDAMADYDLDHCGQIGLAEFLLFLRNKAKEATQKIKELTEFPVMCTDYEPASTPTRYVPPNNGILKLVIIDGFLQKDSYRVMTSSDQTNIMDLAKQTGDFLTMSTYGVQSYKMRYHEAIQVANSLSGETNKVDILIKLLPLMASYTDARMLVSKVLGGDKSEMQKLRREMGPELKPRLGCTDGHYTLELSKESDRQCFSKLIEFSMTMAYRRQRKSALGYGALGDCSQHGNWYGFRNELYNGKPVILTTEFASPLPRSGRLEFDFVSEQRYTKDDYVIDDVKFTNRLMRIMQIRPDERNLVLKRLFRSKIASEYTLHGDGRTIYETPKQKATEIGEYMDQFYSNLNLRQEQIDKYRLKEALKVTTEYNSTNTDITYQNVHKILKIPSIHELRKEEFKEEYRNKEQRRLNSRGKGGIKHSNEEEGLDSITNGSDSVLGAMNNVIVNDDMEDEEDEEEEDDHLNNEELQTEIFETTEVVVDNNIDNDGEQGVPLDDYMLKYVYVMASRNVPNRVKAARTLDLLIDAFEYQHMRSRHLELLCDIFESNGILAHSDNFGSYRIELIVALFPRLVDVHNFEIIMRTLSSYEAACLICRLGWLHLFNPMKPEGFFQLDLSRREERLMVKMLCQLSIVEPGDNLPQKQFRWDRQMDPMPGYEVTEPWLTEEGLPRKGIWDIEYYAGEGKCLNKCKAAVKFRKSLLQMVLIEEEEIQSERAIEKEKVKKLHGVSYMMANLKYWHSYLCYNEEEYKKLQASFRLPTPAKKQR